MPSDPVLVIDAGSSSIRCHLVGIDGCVTGSTSRPWTYVEDPTVSQIAREFDTRACWSSICEAIHECVTGQGRVAAVAITSQRQSIVFLDSDTNVLYAGPNTDLRAVFEGAALDHDHADLLYGATGHRPAFMMAAGKLAWLRDHRPGVIQERRAPAPSGRLARFHAHRQPGMRADPGRRRRTSGLPRPHLGRKHVRADWPADLPGPDTRRH